MNTELKTPSSPLGLLRLSVLNSSSLRTVRCLLAYLNKKSQISQMPQMDTLDALHHSHRVVCTINKRQSSLTTHGDRLFHVSNYVAYTKVDDKCNKTVNVVGQLLTAPATRQQVTWIFTARRTTEQCAVLLSHVVCLSVCPFARLSVTLVDHDHIG